MNTTTLRVTAECSSTNHRTLHEIAVSQFISVDLRHKQTFNEVVMDQGLSDRQRGLVENHILDCGARKSIKVMDSIRSL